MCLATAMDVFETLSAEIMKLFSWKETRFLIVG